MSGGSMNYLYSKLEYEANFVTNTPERLALQLLERREMVQPEISSKRS